MLLNKRGVDIIESDLKTNNLVCFLLGQPGIGKSSIVADICKKNNWLYFELLCNQLAMQADLTGCRNLPYTRDDGTQDYKQVFFPHAVIMDAIDAAIANPKKTIVLFLDEINRTTSAVTSAILTFITARKIGTYALPENIKLIAAGNDDGNVNPLDMASITRFVVRRCEPDATTFLGLGKIHPIIEELLKTQPALIFQTKNVQVNEDDEAFYSQDDNEFQQIATPRTIMGLNNAMLNNSKLIMSMGETELKEYIAGYTGETLFTEAVVTAIVANKYKLVNTATVEAPVKPDFLDELLNAKKITDIQNILNNVGTDDDATAKLSAAILYMVYDTHTDYSAFAKDLANAYTKNMLVNQDMQKLNAIINSGEYNRDAYEQIVSNDNLLTTSFVAIFGN